MKRNFRFRIGIYLVFGDFDLDLHNSYDFTSVDYNVLEQRAVLTWFKSKRPGIPFELPEKVTLTFLSVSSFEFLKRSDEIPFSEDDCLTTAGYLVNEDWHSGVIICDFEPAPFPKHAFEFMSGAVIAIVADQGIAKALGTPV